MPLLFDLTSFALFLSATMLYAGIGAALCWMAAAFWRSQETRRLSVWAIAMCVLLGMFLAWRNIPHPGEEEASLGDMQPRDQTVAELREANREKDRTIQMLRREIDVLSDELSSDTSRDLSIIASLKKQLDDDRRTIDRLTQRLNEKTDR
ncbi:MAG TPA: hypothetical protein VFS39_07520 [Nitrospira sp.]|nr:hypothetical protein [Nitrospira sp.]